MSLMDLVKQRRSVRTFDGNDLTKEDADKIMEYAGNVSNPYNIPVTFKLVSAKRDHLSTPVIVGTDTFIVGKIQMGEYVAEAFGYSFEKVVLYAQSLNIGTTWIAGTMDRPAFEAAAELAEGEIMPAMSPLGYPSNKMSFREMAMRKGIKADKRLEPEKLFFENDFETPFDRNNKVMAELFELVRWAPSAVNKQPWRIVKCGNDIHFYEKRDKGYIDNTGFDLQKVDVGIAMSHFAMGLEEKGMKSEFVISDPGIITPKDTDYIATYRIQ
ncbi:MAG: nitroreductase family protein [Faecalicoccus sp.]|nr:nitroreductase family protein [Faecalicoccus sp.]